MSTSHETHTAHTGNSARHGAGLFDIRNIIGALMALYGLVLLVMSFFTTAADKAKADGANLNLWTGLGLLLLGAAMIGWAVTRPIIIDEEELAEDKAAADSTPHAH